MGIKYLGNTKQIYKTKEWESFKKLIFERDNCCCAKCRRSIFDDVRLQVHHLHYRKNTLPWDVPQSDCITLCKGCHAEEHKLTYPKSGWQLLSVLEGDDDDWSFCEWPGCGEPIKYEHEIYHPEVGVLTVGSTCVTYLTEEAKILNNSIHKIDKKLKTYIEKYQSRILKNDNGSQFHFIVLPKGHEIKLYSSVNNYIYFISVAKKINGFTYDRYNKKLDKNLNYFKAYELALLIIFGWLANDNNDSVTTQAIKSRISKFY